MEINTLLVSSLRNVNKSLQNEPFNTPWCIYADRFAIKKETLFTNSITGSAIELKSIRIWKTKSFLDWWYDDQSSGTFIGALDYVINEDHVKCEYMSIIDVRESGYRNSTSILTEEEITELSNSFINFLKIVSQQENKPKIVVDVHNNLRIYKKFYENEGFHITERRSTDNPFYIEVELPLQDDYCIK